MSGLISANQLAALAMRAVVITILACRSRRYLADVAGVSTDQVLVHKHGLAFLPEDGRLCSVPRAGVEPA